MKMHVKQESIPVGCVPPACAPYLPPDVTVEVGVEVDYGHMGPPFPADRQTQLKTLPSSNFIGGQ